MLKTQRQLLHTLILPVVYTFKNNIYDDVISLRGPLSVDLHVQYIKDHYRKKSGL